MIADFLTNEKRGLVQCPPLHNHPALAATESTNFDTDSRDMSVTSLPGYPFFYAIPISGCVQESIPVQHWSEDSKEDSKESPKDFLPPKYTTSDPLPPVNEIHEMGNGSPVSDNYFQVDTKMFPEKELNDDTANLPKASESKLPLRKIRYPSLPIGRWARASSEVQLSQSQHFEALEESPELSQNRKSAFKSLKARASWSPFRPSVSSPLSASIDPSDFDELFSVQESPVEKKVVPLVDTEQRIPLLEKKLQPNLRRSLHVGKQLGRSSDDMSEEETIQAALIESIYLMLHNLQPTYLPKSSSQITPTPVRHSLYR